MLFFLGGIVVLVIAAALAVATAAPVIGGKVPGYQGRVLAGYAIHTVLGIAGIWLLLLARR